MAVIVNSVKTSITAKPDEIIDRAIKLCGIPRDSVAAADVHKTSIDARRREKIHLVHSVYLELCDPAAEERLCTRLKFCRHAPYCEISPQISKCRREGRVVVAGFGPAGMFCALLLAKYGYRPLVLEKGAAVEKRDRLVERFWRTGELDENTNVQFGEGGAGTFSDGKLTTRINDPLCRYVLERFSDFGADRSILTKAKPHIGTDILKNVVKNLRSEIINLGGEICFETPLEGITLRNGSVYSVKSPRGEERCAALVVACGHSAKETFRLLQSGGIELLPKPFSVGVRVEHKRQAVDESLYGEYAHLLPPGEYNLSHRNSEGRGVYTFCMCPGGTVVASSSERGGVVTNGMSEFARNGENSNSAVVVSVSPSDFGSGVFDGLDFAGRIERAAYSGGYSAPATSVGGFLSGKPTLKNLSVTPTYARGVREAELREIFPKFVTDMLAEGFAVFARKMHCFGDENALLTAPETRTSSPIKIPRSDESVSSRADNLYPCGEGAGYAGGIMSAAVDGLKTAMKIMESMAP